jgi:predicted phosphodiesterase
VTPPSPKSLHFLRRPAAMLLPAAALGLLFLLLRPCTSPLLAGMNLGSGTEIIRGPYVQVPELSSSTLAVVWETNFPCKGSLYYWTSIIDTKKVESTQAGTRHSVLLKNLDPAKTYFYRVEAGSRFSRKYSLRSFPAGEKKYSFLVYGDTRYNHRAHQALVQEMKKVEAAFVIHTGDFVDYGNSLGDWDIFFFIVRPLAARIPVFPVIGNHDYAKGGSETFKSMFLLPPDSPNPGLDYFFDTGNARFIIMENRFAGKKGGAQKKWLEKILKEARKQKKLDHVFVSLHQGIGSSGPHGPDEKLKELGYIDLMKKHGVTMVIGGHDHIYERGMREGLRYLVSGGGGAPIYTKEKNSEWTQLRASERHFILFSVDGGEIAFKVIRADGSFIEECALTPLAWKCSQPSPAVTK